MMASQQFNLFSDGSSLQFAVTDKLKDVLKCNEEGEEFPMVAADWKTVMFERPGMVIVPIHCGDSVLEKTLRFRSDACL